MTATAVTNDRIRPTEKEIATYTARETELRVRFLKGVLHIGQVLQGLQDLQGMTNGTLNCNTQPQIPDWADREYPIFEHLSCGMNYPSKFTTKSVFEKGEDSLHGEKYITRALKLNSGNACGFDFFSIPQNWKYLPDGVVIIVFPKTIFRHSRGGLCVRYLSRRGAKWYRRYIWLGLKLDHRFLVGVFASSAESLEPKVP